MADRGGMEQGLTGCLNGSVQGVAVLSLKAG